MYKQKLLVNPYFNLTNRHLILNLLFKVINLKVIHLKVINPKFNLRERPRLPLYNLYPKVDILILLEMNGEGKEKIQGDTEGGQGAGCSIGGGVSGKGVDGEE